MSHSSMINRFAILAFFPFLAGAIVPWLSVESIGRAQVISLFWGVAVNLVLATMVLTASFFAEASARIRLNRLVALLLIFMAVMPALLFAAGSVLLAIALMTVNIQLVVIALKKTSLWAMLSETQMAFCTRLSWTSVGCMLMLLLSSYRSLQAI